MAKKAKYSSEVIILKEEDRGFRRSRPPAGYVRIETREGKEKITAVVQDLKDIGEYSSYNLYLIKFHENEMHSVFINNIDTKNGNGKLIKEFEPLNVGKAKLQVEDFNIVAVIFEGKDRGKEGVKCPLVFYRGRPLKWIDIFSKRKDELVLHTIETIQGTKAVDEDKRDENKRKEQSIKMSEKCQEIPKETQKALETEKEVEVAMETVIETVTEAETVTETETKEETETVENRGLDTNILTSYFDKVFRRCDPFNTRRRDYKWWKIHSHEYLTNVLQYCNIRTPSIFNPLVTMAYYKYRYLIAGIHISKSKRKEYIVLGIPGTYSIDDSPLGDVCKWVQAEGNMPRYGSLGYWITYIDPETGKLLRIG